MVIGLLYLIFICFSSFSCILALPPFCSLSHSSPSVSHWSPLLSFLASHPLSGLFLYLQIEYQCFAYDAMQFVAGRTPIFSTFQSLFPPFTLTAACSLPMSLLTQNHIKTPTVWLLQARQLWPHFLLFSLHARFRSPCLTSTSTQQLQLRKVAFCMLPFSPPF